MKKMMLSLVTSWLLLGACATTPNSRDPSSTTQDLVAFEKSFRSKDLFEVREQILARKGVDGVKKHNDKLLSLLTSMEAPQVSGKWKASLQVDEAHQLFDWLESHPVASSHKVMKYDPKLQIGFCFGRATAVHLEVLGKPFKLHPSSVRKIWVFGPMEGGWGHHVATMVLTQNSSGANEFLVIDPVTGVVSAESWIQNIQSEYQVSEREPLMYFVTEPSRFGPYPGRYTRMELFGPDRGNRNTDAYRGYFDDLMKKFRLDRVGRQPSSESLMASAIQKAFAAEFESVPNIAEKSSEGRDEVLVQMEFDFVKDL